MKKYKYRRTFTWQKKRYSVYADTLEEIGIKKANKLAMLERNERKTHVDITLEDWSEKCIETYKTTQSERSKYVFKRTVHHCILSHIGYMRVKDITPMHCQQVLNYQAGKSTSYIRAVSTAMKFLFAHAVHNDIIDKDPTAMLKPPKGTYTPRRALTAEEREIFLAIASGNPKYYCFLLMIYCGCRPKEACECKGSDIYMLDGHPMLHIRGTKTKRADRTVPIPLDLYALIKDTASDAYIAEYKGKSIPQRTRERLWKSLWRAMNIQAGTPTYRNALVPPYRIPKDLTPYCLRHEFCSNLARNNVDIRIAQRLMGHSNINLTANIYTHVDNKDIIEAMGSTLGRTLVST